MRAERARGETTVRSKKCRELCQRNIARDCICTFCVLDFISICYLYIFVVGEFLRQIPHVKTFMPLGWVFSRHDLDARRAPPRKLGQKLVLCIHRVANVMAVSGEVSREAKEPEPACAPRRKREEGVQACRCLTTVPQAECARVELFVHDTNRQRRPASAV